MVFWYLHMARREGETRPGSEGHCDAAQCILGRHRKQTIHKFPEELQMHVHLFHLLYFTL
jgi:hypothetical protein